MRGGQRQRDLGLPPGEERHDVGVAQAVTDGLQDGGLPATEKAVVEREKGDAPARELAFRPLVAIEADLDGVGVVATDLDEGGAPLGIQDII